MGAPLLVALARVAAGGQGGGAVRGAPLLAALARVAPGAQVSALRWPSGDRAGADRVLSGLLRPRMGRNRWPAHFARPAALPTLRPRRVPWHPARPVAPCTPSLRRRPSRRTP